LLKITNKVNSGVNLGQVFVCQRVIKGFKIILNGQMILVILKLMPILRKNR